MRYSFHDLQDQFDAATLETAGHELEQGRVALPDIRQDGRLITSLIQVPGPRPVRVYVRIDLDQANVPRIHGECSCCKKGNCEHVAAVLLHALADQEDLPGAGREPVLQGPLPNQQGADLHPNGVEQRLLYLLFPEPGNNISMDLETVSARQLKGGGLRPFAGLFAGMGNPGSAAALYPGGGPPHPGRTGSFVRRSWRR